MRRLKNPLQAEFYLIKPRARIHDGYIKAKRILWQGFFLLTRNFGLWCIDHTTFVIIITNAEFVSIVAYQQCVSIFAEAGFF